MPSTLNNMNLSVPLNGETDYPTSISDSLTNIDNHDHTSGNGVQIPTDGIEDDAVTTAKILALNVTTAKIAALAVTRAKQEAVGHQISSDISASALTNGSYADLTNATISITTTGRPVVIGIMQSTGAASLINIQYSVAFQASIDVLLLRDATPVHAVTMGQTLTPTAAIAISGSAYLEFPGSSLQFFDVPAAGTYTYKLQGKLNIGTQYTIIGRLFAYEL